MLHQVTNENLQENESISTILKDPHQRAREEVTDQNDQTNLTKEQYEMVKHGKISITPAQRKLINECNQKVHAWAAKTLGEGGPSQTKGKEPDPCNWGNANLSEEDLDPDVQQQILNECNTHQKN